ncbi:MAG: hypothetical protein L3J73_03770, partial [Thermoplasmata archaeon]|nr:hypothetical protein [Thermoplasmata archaeon]
LDPAARADLRRILRDLRRDGRTLLLSTHLLDDVEEVCSRVLFLREGQLVGDEPVELRPVDADGRPLRTLSLAFAQDVEAGLLRSTIGPIERFDPSGPRSVTVRFAGGDARQSEMLAAIVRSGHPLLSAAEANPTLGQRYLDRVGREDPE